MVASWSYLHDRKAGQVNVVELAGVELAGAVVVVAACVVVLVDGRVAGALVVDWATQLHDLQPCESILSSATEPGLHLCHQPLNPVLSAGEKLQCLHARTVSRAGEDSSRACWASSRCGGCSSGCSGSGSGSSSSGSTSGGSGACGAGQDTAASGATSSVGAVFSDRTRFAPRTISVRCILAMVAGDIQAGFVCLQARTVAWARTVGGWWLGR
jgi:hypothetical protein